ncbi:MAG: (d)CMP kinase [Verrucomicrobiota bacterium]|nr:(d)CMP kinase [Verrucomicrobiota bacterium]
MTNSARYHRIIAIDGPAASGKSSVARELAAKIGFVYVNSGAMYRAVTWHVLERGIDPRNRSAVEDVADELQFECDLDGNESRIMIGGVDPTPHLRDARVNDGVSLVSSVPRVREVLVKKMRDYVLEHDVVMEGRDIGSVVFPKTPFKFYIDASPEIRSQRRAAQGQTDRITARDHADSSRSASPLTVAAEAEVIDTSELSIAAVVVTIIDRLRAKGFEAAA